MSLKLLIPFSSPILVFTLAFFLRVILLLYGLYQDANSPLKYTDIDYFVFTDAARFAAHGRSPYDRETYRYTPLLAWLLLPTAWPGRWWFSFGKAIFVVGDLVAGILIYDILRGSGRRGLGMDRERASRYASLWLLNPMVAAISTRGSSESLLAVMVMGCLWAVLRGWVGVAGVVLGLAVHFKIYPFVYAVAIAWWLDDANGGGRWGIEKRSLGELQRRLLVFANPARVTLAVTSLTTFMALNLWMYNLYGHAFLQNTYLHHLTRIDHRHNFSPYNTLLYLSSSSSSITSASSSSTTTSPTLHLESLAFLPQLFLSALAIPFALAKKDLPSTMLAQTWAFVAFNK
ncbi:MAG: hypothetical protein L6R40_008775, partial [Gallowayella cf. fulva]